MGQDQPNNPLHGMTLKAILEELVARHGWDGMADRIPVNCFAFEPSMKSSLKFLRRTPWAREKVEQLYLYEHQHLEKRRRANRRRAEMRANRTSTDTPDTPSPAADAINNDV